MTISGGLKMEAQETGPSPEFKIMQSGILKLYALHDSLFDPRVNLVNGRLFSPQGDMINHPFFIANEWQSGKIWYYGQVFEMDMLKYDICTDNLIHVFTSDSTAFPVIMNKENVSQFVIGYHHFKYDEVLLDNDHFKAGYYEVLYDKGTTLYLRHEKSKTRDKLTLEPEFPLKVTVYLKRGGKYFQIKNQKDFITSFGDRENEIRSFMKQNNIRFTSKKHEPIIQVLEYFDKQNAI